MPENEVMWLSRRREILDRAIREMEQHEEEAHLDEKLNPDVPGSLLWARSELRRIDARLVELGSERTR